MGQADSRRTYSTTSERTNKTHRDEEARKVEIVEDVAVPRSASRVNGAGGTPASFWTAAKNRIRVREVREELRSEDGNVVVAYNFAQVLECPWKWGWRRLRLPSTSWLAVGCDLSLGPRDGPPLCRCEVASAADAVRYSTFRRYGPSSLAAPPPPPLVARFPPPMPPPPMHVHRAGLLHQNQYHTLSQKTDPTWARGFAPCNPFSPVQLGIANFFYFFNVNLL